MTDRDVRKLDEKRQKKRVSASMPPDLLRTLEDIARQKKVSLAWVIRDAAEKYVAAQ